MGPAAGSDRRPATLITFVTEHLPPTCRVPVHVHPYAPVYASPYADTAQDRPGTGLRAQRREKQRARSAEQNEGPGQAVGGWLEGAA